MILPATWRRITSAPELPQCAGMSATMESSTPMPKKAVITEKTVMTAALLTAPLILNSPALMRLESLQFAQLFAEMGKQEEKKLVMMVTMPMETDAQQSVSRKSDGIVLLILVPNLPVALNIAVMVSELELKLVQEDVMMPTTMPLMVVTTTAR